jgi:hypothetical protein
MSEPVWNAVVVENEEDMSVEHEGMDSFTVEYVNQDQFDSALARFDGMIHYIVL